MHETSHVKRILVPTVTIAALLVVWELSVRLGFIANFLLPMPSQVFEQLVTDFPNLMYHASVTSVEAIVGLIIGALIGFTAAVLMDRFEGVELALNPLLTISQTIPSVAIAPLLVIWFGYELAPKIVLVVISTFFPVTVSLVAGFRSVDQDEIDLMRTMGASDLQIFRYVKLPAATSELFSGLRISATYAIMGAVVAEWLGGVAGMGVYMTRARKSFAYSRMFAVIILISALSILLMKLVDLIEWIALPWKRNRDAAAS